MSTPCQGCKALVVQTVDDYQVYSLQRALYPVNPLMIIPQPNSWVDHVCADRFVVHKLYTQGEDWTTFWQQVLAECANHTVVADPIVISDPNTDSGGNPPPEVDPNTDPNTDPVPGPGDLVPPPLEPPGGGGTGGTGGGTGGGTPPGGKGSPNGPPAPPGARPVTTPNPPNNPGKQWAEVNELSYAAVSCTYEQADPNHPDFTFIWPSTTDYAFAFVIADMKRLYASFTGPKAFYYWMEPTWEPFLSNDDANQHSIATDQGNFETDGSPWADILNYYGTHNILMSSYFFAQIKFKFIYEVDI